MQDESENRKEDSGEEEAGPAAQPNTASDRRHEYYRQPVFLSSDRCPYLPHVLHFIRLATGTLLVLVSEVRTCTFDLGDRVVEWGGWYLSHVRVSVSCGGFEALSQFR